MNLFIVGIIKFLDKAGFYTRTDHKQVNTITCVFGKFWLCARHTQPKNLPGLSVVFS